MSEKAQFLGGLKAIEDEIDAECDRRGVSDRRLTHTARGTPTDIRFDLQIEGREVGHRFTREEVVDSHNGATPFVRAKVRAFVTMGLTKPDEPEGV